MEGGGSPSCLTPVQVGGKISAVLRPMARALGEYRQFIGDVEDAEATPELRGPMGAEVEDGPEDKAFWERQCPGQVQRPRNRLVDQLTALSPASGTLSGFGHQR